MIPIEVIFEPIYNSNDLSFWLGAGLGTFGLIMCLLLLKIKKNIWAMLAFFATLIAFSTAFFGWWAKAKTIPVTITEDTFQTQYGTTKLRDIKSAFIQDNNSETGVIKRKNAKILVVRTTSEQVHVLSELDFPIEDVKTALDKAIFALE